MLTCPHCGEQAISPLNKLLLGPAGSVRCNHCRKRISVSWFSALLTMPAVIFISVQRFLFSSIWAMAASSVVVVILVLVLHVKRIPLVRR